MLMTGPSEGRFEDTEGPGQLQIQMQETEGGLFMQGSGYRGKCFYFSLATLYVADS